MVEGLLFRTGSASFWIFLAWRRDGVMALLHGIHAPVGFGQQPFDVETIVGARCHADTQGDHVSSANVPA
jgi:hypothetical protein